MQITKNLTSPVAAERPTVSLKRRAAGHFLTTSGIKRVWSGHNSSSRRSLLVCCIGVLVCMKSSKNHTASTITLSSASLRRGWSYRSEVGVDFNVGQMIT